MIEITIGSTYHDRQMNQIHVLDIAENFNRKSGENSKVVLGRLKAYTKNTNERISLIKQRDCF